MESSMQRQKIAMLYFLGLPMARCALFALWMKRLFNGLRWRLRGVQRRRQLCSFGRGSEGCGVVVYNGGTACGGNAATGLGSWASNCGAACDVRRQWRRGVRPFAAAVVVTRSFPEIFPQLSDRFNHTNTRASCKKPPTKEHLSQSVIFFFVPIKLQYFISSIDSTDIHRTGKHHGIFSSCKNSNKCRTRINNFM
jgi:hypothetical protein